MKYFAHELRQKFQQGNIYSLTVFIINNSQLGMGTCRDWQTIVIITISGYPDQRCYAHYFVGLKDPSKTSISGQKRVAEKTFTILSLEIFPSQF